MMIVTVSTVHENAVSGNAGVDWTVYCANSPKLNRESGPEISKVTGTFGS